jgi:hypothetical protein
MSWVRHLVVALLVAAPTVASACPACVGQNRNTTILRLVGAFMLVPFGIFYVVQRTVRRELRDRELHTIDASRNCSSDTRPPSV